MRTCMSIIVLTFSRYLVWATIQIIITNNSNTICNWETKLLLPVATDTPGTPGYWVQLLYPRRRSTNCKIHKSTGYPGTRLPVPGYPATGTRAPGSVVGSKGSSYGVLFRPPYSEDGRTECKPACTPSVWICAHCPNLCRSFHLGRAHWYFLSLLPPWCLVFFASYFDRTLGLTRLLFDSPCTWPSFYFWTYSY